MVCPVDVVFAKTSIPGFAAHRPKSNAGATGFVSRCLQELKKFRSDTRCVSRACRDEDGNVKQPAIEPMFSDCINAQTLDVSPRINRQDRFFSFACLLMTAERRSNILAELAPLVQAERGRNGPHQGISAVDSFGCDRLDGIAGR
jgi:hypothetical protein